MIEICCGSYEDAMNAYNGGATRIELNSALHLGGLTPSVASLKMVKANTKLTVICMVRPRAAGFCYDKYEYRQMLLEAKDLLEAGCDGLAFGFLHENHQIDLERTKEFVALCKKYRKTAVFHRAFDCVNDPYQSIESLIELGVDRILTSGLKAKALDGIELIKELQAKYGDKIEILAGSGVNATNAKEIMETAKIKQIHSSCKTWRTDLTTSGKDVNYCYGPEGHRDDYDVVSLDLVKQLVKLGL